MNTKQVLLDNIVFSLQRAGGISVVWENIITALQRCGLEYECLEYPSNEGNIVRKAMVPFNCRKIKSLSMWIERYSNPYIEASHPFIFHSSYYRTCTNKNSINITTVHDFTYELFNKGIAAKVHRWQKFRAIRKSDVVVCISENTKQDLLRFLPDVNPEKIRVIYNGVSEDYKPVETHRWDSLGKYVIFVGSRQPYKQFQFTVEAIKDTPHKLAIVGGKLSETELAFLDSAIGKDKYVYTGFLSNEALNELYNQAVCLAYPSAYEGFGIPVLEAQRAGCPVIAYNTSSIPEVIGETPLLLNNLTVSEFHDKLNLLRQDTIRKEIIASGLENSLRFSWKKMGEEYVELYKELLNK